MYDKTGFSCAGTCSAAECALLALPFTLAMHEVVGFLAPLFIAPLARASGESGANFAQTLLQASRGKHLTLTFTPAELRDRSKSFKIAEQYANRGLRLLEDEVTGNIDTETTSYELIAEMNDMRDEWFGEDER